MTNNKNVDGFHEWLLAREPKVVRLEERLDASLAHELSPRFAVSFNYRYIIAADAIEALGCDIVNVHCSVLPWNRGASPNFFSYLHNTPKGVTVHRLTAGLDRGDVLLQRVLPLTEDESFASSYAKLLECAEGLMKDNWKALSDGRIVGRSQPVGGSYNTVADFEAARKRWPFEWDTVIGEWKALYGLG